MCSIKFLGCRRRVFVYCPSEASIWIAPYGQPVWKRALPCEVCSLVCKALLLRRDLASELQTPQRWLACVAQLLDTVRALKPECMSADGFSVEALHAALQQRGYIVELKHTGNCAARSVGRRCLENLHHTYIVCRGSLADAVTVGPLAACCARVPPAARASRMRCS